MDCVHLTQTRCGWQMVDPVIAGMLKKIWNEWRCECVGSTLIERMARRGKIGEKEKAQDDAPHRGTRLFLHLVQLCLAWLFTADQNDGRHGRDDTRTHGRRHAETKLARLLAEEKGCTLVQCPAGVEAANPLTACRRPRRVAQAFFSLACDDLFSFIE